MENNYMKSGTTAVAKKALSERELQVKMAAAAKEADKFVKSYGFRRQMQMHARVVSVTGTKIKLKINVGGGAYTNGVEVTVCIPEAMLLESKEVWLIGVKSLIAHEFGHINFSDFRVWRTHQEKVANYFFQTHGLRNMQGFGAHMLNCTEDGRMEKLQATFRPGMLKYFQFTNSFFWKLSECSGDELNDFLLQMVNLSVNGLVTQDFDARYAGTECERRVNDCRRYIVKAINCNDAQKCADFTLQMIEKVGDYIADLIKSNPNALNQLNRDPEYDTQPSVGKGEMKNRTKLVVHLVPEKNTANPEDQMTQEEFERLIDEYDEVEFVIDEPEEGSDENQEDSNSDQSGPSVPMKGKGKEEASNQSKSESGDGQRESSEGEEESDQSQGGGSSAGEAGEESEEDGDASGNGASGAEEAGEGEEEQEGKGSGSESGEGSDEESSQEGNGEGSEGESSEQSQGAGQDSANADSSAGEGSKEAGESNKVDKAQSSNGKNNTKRGSQKNNQFVYTNFDNGKAADAADSDELELEDEDQERSDANESNENEEEQAALTPEELAALVDAGLEQLLEELESETAEILGDIEQDNKREDARIQRESRENSQLTDAELRGLINNKYGSHAFIYRNSRTYDFGEIPTLLQMQGRKFRKDMEVLLKNRAGYSLQNQRKGKLDGNKLWQLSVGEYRIFEKKSDPNETDYAISILIDNSGSMGARVDDPETGAYINTRAACAKNACVVFEEGLKGLVPLKIARFEANGTITHHEVRSFNETSKKKNYSWEMDTSTGGGNADGYSIDVAAHELAKRPEKEKILFVLSDGSPVGYSTAAQGMTHVKESVAAARKNGIRVIAIRFGDDQVDTYKYMYEHSYITCHPKDIQRQLIKILKKTMNK